MASLTAPAGSSSRSARRFWSKAGALRSDWLAGLALDVAEPARAARR
jgi:hypothetical protein